MEKKPIKRTPEAIAFEIEEELETWFSMEARRIAKQSHCIMCEAPESRGCKARIDLTAREIREMMHSYLIRRMELQHPEL